MAGVACLARGRGQMSEIFANEQVSTAITKRAYGANTEKVLEVRVDTATGELIFIGTDALAKALEYGINVEKYLTDKLTQMRDRCVDKC
jgi:hypothetical protein